jgi:nicotinamidase-related amidase
MTWNARKYDPEWPFDLMETDFKLSKSSTALLVIDLQEGDVRYDPDSKLARKYPEMASDYYQRLAEIVIPQAAALLDFFRTSRRKVIYTRNGPMTSRGDEVTARLKSKIDRTDDMSQCNRDNPRYQIIRELAPQPEDLVVDKVTSGAFTASTLDHALHNMKITDVVLVGILTDMCIFGTARAAAELGYNTAICENACASLTERAHHDALIMHARTFGRVMSTEEIRNELK